MNILPVVPVFELSAQPVHVQGHTSEGPKSRGLSEARPQDTWMMHCAGSESGERICERVGEK